MENQSACTAAGADDEPGPGYTKADRPRFRIRGRSQTNQHDRRRQNNGGELHRARNTKHNHLPLPFIENEQA
jgi:hypothetical protein